MTGKWRAPAADLDDAPILVGEVPDDDPELDSMRVDEEDTQLYTETQADLNQLLTTERRRNDQAAALAAERARWQQRVDDLQRRSPSATSCSPSAIAGSRSCRRSSRPARSNARAWPRNCANRAR